MKIKSIRYERLFNVGEYQNETIGFIADVDEKEKPEIALAKLYEMVTVANKRINEIRNISNKLFSLQREDYCYCSSIKYSERIIQETMNELKELQKEKPVDKFMIDRKKGLIKKYKKELKEKLEQEQILTKQYQQMVNDFKKGIL